MPLTEVPRAVGRRMTDPKPLAKAVAGELDQLAGRTVASALDLTRGELLALFAVAARLQTGPPAADALRGKIVLTAFFEPSTRTRLSFESAAHRLGASVISIPDARFTSVDKGETLADTGVMFDGYADIVVLRHFADSAVDDIRSGGMTTPLINGGNGCREHPTQALADWYALCKWRPQLTRPELVGNGDRLSVGVLGAPRRMRALRSFLLIAAQHFAPAVGAVTIVSDDADPLDTELASVLDRHGVAYRCSTEFDGIAPEFDVIYQNSLGLAGEHYRELESTYRIDARTPLKPGAVVMHPLARKAELGTDLDDTPHNLYFDQAAGAVFVRQALLLAIGGRVTALNAEF